MMKFSLLCAAAVIGSAATAQTQPTTTTTQSTTTATQPTTTPPAPTTTQTTTSAPTTTPEGTPATTTQTTTTETKPATTPAGTPAAKTTQTTTKTTEVVKAKAEDMKTGASVYGQNGELIGTLEAVKADSAVVNTGKTRAEIPSASFGKNDKGLVLGITKADLDAKATAKPKG